MITGIDRPTAGTVTFDGQRLDELSEEELAVWRGANVGIIFQFFQLLPTLSALENAVLHSLSARRGAPSSGEGPRDPCSRNRVARGGNAEN